MRSCYRHLPDGVDRQWLFFGTWVTTSPSEYRCAERGDLLFLQHRTAAQPSHVGIVADVSTDQMTIIHASESRSAVVEDRWWYRRRAFHDEYSVVGFGRVRPLLVRVLLDERMRSVREAMEAGEGGDAT
jgi:hypothetical protein